MEPLSRITPATLDVLGCLLEATGPTWGLMIIKRSGRPAGTIYPVLDRLERLGWVTSEWDDAADRSGPRRRLYRLTAEGATTARQTVAVQAAKAVGRAARVSGAGA
jgi:DNA-binding PadR family transcriptional regulator